MIVAIATGRTPAATLELAREIGFEGPCVCTDGAMIMDIASGDTLRHTPLGRAPSQVLARSMGGFPNVSAAVLWGSTVLLDRQGGVLERVARAWSPLVEQTERLLDHHAWKAEDGITAAAVIGLRAEIGTIAEQVRAQPVTVTHFDVTRFEGVSSLIVHGEAVSKGHGLRWLASHYGVALEETAAVGDWLNDVSMLKTAPRSFAMAHAPEEVKSSAKRVLRASRETGGAIAEIEAYLRSDMGDADGDGGSAGGGGAGGGGAGSSS